MKRLRSFCHRGRGRGRTAASLVACAFLLASGCAGVERRLFERPFDPDAVAVLKAGLEEQRDRVRSFFSAGRLQVKGWQGRDVEAAVFSAWTASPRRIKIELTHSWGQPMLHLLVDGEVFRLLSFGERKLYTGPFTGRSLSKVLPGEMDPDLIEDLLRSYPVVEPGLRALSKEPHQISFYGAEGEERRTIKFDRHTLRPAEVVVPYRSIRLVFGDFQSVEGLHFAREAALVHVLGGRRLVRQVDTMVFNRTIPDPVFTLQAPPGFETVYLFP